MKSVETLDTLFKKNSKYYKKISNKDMIVTKWECGAGGDFITRLFLDKIIDKTIKNNQYYSDIIFFEGNLHKNLSDQLTINKIFDLDISEEIVKEYDYVLYQTFLQLNSVGRATLTRLNKFICTHYNGFALSKFYFKNSEKIKIISIDIDNDLRKYITLLCSAKTGPNAYDAYFNLNNSGYARYRTMNRDEHKYIVNVIDEIYQMINISKSTIVSGIISYIIEKSIILDKNIPSFYNNKNWFLNKIKTDLENMFTNDMLYPIRDLETIFKDQTYILNYKKLIFNQDITIIKDLMNFYGSSEQPDYYKTQIEKYHTENLKLINKIKNELPVAIKNIEKELQND